MSIQSTSSVPMLPILYPSSYQFSEEEKRERDFAIIAYQANLATEGMDIRDRMLRHAADGVEIYEVGEVGLSESSPKSLVNDASNAVIASTDIQLRDEPSPQIVPTEIGEGGPSFWIGNESDLGRAVIPTAQTMDPTTGQMITTATMPIVAPNSTEPLSPQQVEALKAAGLENSIVTIDDAEWGKFQSTIFTKLWKRSNCIQFVRNNLLYTNIKGYQPVWYRFDKQGKKHILKNIPLCQIRCDIAERVDDCAWVMVDMIFDVGEAIDLFPDLVDKINEHAETGTIGTFDNGQWSTIVDRNYQRPMIAMRFTWYRHQAIPLDEQQAIQMGEVTERFTPATQPCQQCGGTGRMAADDDIMDQPCPACAGSGQIPGDPTRSLHLADGEQVDVGHPAWPAMSGIRETIQMRQEIVSDGPCKEHDIPVAINIDKPVLHTPFGYGEPYQIEELQKAKNRGYRAIVDHAQFYRHPIMFGPKSLSDALGGTVNMAKPGQFYSVQDSLFATMQNAKLMIDPPQMSPSLVNGLNQISGETDKQSQFSPVLQGYAPGSNSSGAMVDKLQQAASSLIGFKSKGTEEVIKRICRLMNHAMIRDLSTPDLMRIVSKYPMHVVDAFVQKGQASEWDVEVEVTTGTGGQKAARQAEDSANLQIGAISKQTYREGQKIDHVREEQRIQKENEQTMAAQQAAAMQQPMPAQ